MATVPITDLIYRNPDNSRQLLFDLPSHFQFTSFVKFIVPIYSYSNRYIRVYILADDGRGGQNIYAGSYHTTTGWRTVGLTSALNNNLALINELIADGVFRGLYVTDSTQYFSSSVTGTSGSLEMLPDVVDEEAPPVEVIALASPATATATAPAATVRIYRDASIEAGAMNVVATMHNATWVRGNYFVRALATSVKELNSSGVLLGDVTNNDNLLVAGNAYYALQVPTPDIGRDDVVNVALRLQRNNTQINSVSLYGAHREGNTWIRHDDEAYSGSYSNNVYTFTVPAGTEWLWLHLNGGTGFVDGIVDNPGNDNSRDTSYFTLEVEPDLGTYVDADPFVGTAEMVNPDVDTVKGALHGATPALATATMPGGRFPHNNVNAVPATATATMGASWFKSNRTVSADVMDVAVEAPEIAGVSVGRNISVPVQPAVMRNAWIVNPMEVNEEVSDPYWLRVMGRAAAGSRPARPSTWYRLNERGGDTAFSTNPQTGMKNTAGYTLEGDYEWGQPGPNGKRALKINNAAMGTMTIGQQSGQNLTAGSSLEFTLKVAPGHTGRMDLFWGRVENTGQGHPRPQELDVRVVDGRLWARTSKGGTSVRRIDDGQFHHIVITTNISNTGGIWQLSHTSLEIWIDGKLDRALVTNDNRGGDNSAQIDSRLFAPPRRFFGLGSDYPFQGEILDIVFRRAELRSHEIMDLYLDMFGYKAARAGVIEGARGEAFQGAKVESNMKRMLMITWQIPRIYNSMVPQDDSALSTSPTFDRSISVPLPTGRDEPVNPILSPMGMYKNLGAKRYGGTEEWDLGRFLLTYQRVDATGPAFTEEALSRVRHEQSTTTNATVLRDPVTGKQRLINLQTDVNLDDFDVIAFQAYPNPQYRNQDEREAYEAFFDSVKQAMVDGHKFWITDAYLAADLGLVSDVEYVPTMGRMLSNGRISNIFGNDVRGYEVFPTVTINPGQDVEQGISAGTSGLIKAKNGPIPFAKPEDGSMPELPTGTSLGSQEGRLNMWRFDFHQNNGFRVRNEVEGLTDIPSWEMDEMAGREKAIMFSSDLTWEQYAYRLKNRSGEDYVWEWKRDASDEVHELVKPSERRGLKAGDEFYDFDWYNYIMGGMSLDRPFDSALARRMSGQMRALGTWAIPPGHLRAGIPVTTFRSTVWNDYGEEVTNPYKDFVRTAVIRPGDRLPDGRKVQGAVFMEFAQHPKWDALWGYALPKQLTAPPGVVPVSENRMLFRYVESEYSFDWDYNTHGRFSYTGGGEANVSQTTYLVAYDRDKTGELILERTPMTGAATLPIAQSISEVYPVDYVPHWTWNGRGLAWLLGLGVIDAEYSVTLGETMRASGEMRSPMVSTEFDNEVTVGAAEANGRAVDPEEATVKDTQVMAWAATASGRMMGLQGGYRAQAATAHAMMLQNVLRPLDVEEVLFFTVSFTQKTIYLRMEEN